MGVRRAIGSYVPDLRVRAATDRDSWILPASGSFGPKSAKIPLTVFDGGIQGDERVGCPVQEAGGYAAMQGRCRGLRSVGASPATHAFPGVRRFLPSMRGTSRPRASAMMQDPFRTDIPQVFRSGPAASMFCGPMYFSEIRFRRRRSPSSFLERDAPGMRGWLLLFSPRQMWSTSRSDTRQSMISPSIVGSRTPGSFVPGSARASVPFRPLHDPAEAGIGRRCRDRTSDARSSPGHGHPTDPQKRCRCRRPR